MIHKILAADMWPAMTFGDPNGIYSDFLATGRPRFKGLLESILLFDEIHVPTDSFMSLTLLVGVLGEHAIHELLDSGVLRFLRLRGGLVYIGNGGGLLPYEIHSKEKRPHAQFSALDEAIKWALGGLDSQPDIKALMPKVIEATQEIDISGLVGAVRERTYRTILDSYDLRNAFALRNTSLDHLSGIAPNQVRTWGGFDKPNREPLDEIDVTLRIARSYLEAIAAERIGGADITTATPIGFVVAQEEARQKLDFSILHQISDVPDIGEVVLTEQATVSDLVKLRGSYHWPKFRNWFHEHCADDPLAVSKAYIELLKETPAADTLFGRTIRFLMTGAAGIVNPLAGVAAAALDYYVTPEIHGPSPKFFIEKLEQLAPKQKPEA